MNLTTLICTAAIAVAGFERVDHAQPHPPEKELPARPAVKVVSVANLPAAAWRLNLTF